MNPLALLTRPRRTDERAVLGALVIFVLVLAIDVVRIAATLPRALGGDEWRYVHYANNLLHGFYSPRDRVFISNGPAYPLFLAPFLAAGWLDGARYANAVFHALSLVYAWLVLNARLKVPWSLAAVGLLFLYLPTSEFLPLLYTELSCFFLVCAWTYHALNIDQARFQTSIAGVYLAVLALTKVIFGYVLVAFLAIALVNAVWTRSKRAWRRHAAAAGLALVLCVPYLAYTYSLTGRFFHWNSLGPNSFYWLTTPYPEEVGDWYHQGWVQQNPILRAHHLALFEEASGLAKNPNLSAEEQVLNLSTPEANDLFARAARKNVREHPLKFAKNWLYNLVRLFLDVPVSVRRTPFWNLYSKAHLAMLAFTGYVVVRAWRTKVLPAANFVPVLLFGALGFAAYSLSSATARFLFPVVPIWWLGAASWLARVAQHSPRSATRASP
jgi:hypothetical protein